MKLVQFHIPGTGDRLGVLEAGRVYDLTAVEPVWDSLMTLIEIAGGKAGALEELVAEKITSLPDEAYDYEELEGAAGVADSSSPRLLIPIVPAEVWGFGVTYQRSAEVRDADIAKEMDSSASIYDRVYHSERPECFFKATAPRCVGPRQGIGIRSDSALTATEPELAYVLGAAGEIVGYTICNDVSAWDIERDNPLYLPQSKIFTGCCAIGPVIATQSEVPDPYDLEIGCRIIRGAGGDVAQAAAGDVIFSEETSSGRIGRRFEELNEYLYRNNPVPMGTIVSTGTGIMVPNEFALVAGDIVEIEIERIGVLSNTAVQL